MGIHRGHNAHPFEWLAEKAILFISLSAILMIFLIFIFIGREALPIFLSQMNSASKQEIIPASQIDSIPPEMERAQLEEVRRRIAQVESGTVRLIPGEQALDQVRRLVASARVAS